MGVRIRDSALVTVVLIAVAACASTGPGSPEAARSQGATSAAALTPSPDPIAPTAEPSPPRIETRSFGPIPEELVGTWAFDSFGRAWTITLGADGTFDLYQAGALDMSGSFGVRGDEIEFTDKQPGPAGGFCGRLVYTYRWQVTEGRMDLTMIDDDCVDGWARGATEGLSKVP